MYLEKYSAIGNSAIGNDVVLYSKLMLKTVLLEVSYGKYDYSTVPNKRIATAIYLAKFFH